MNEFKRGLLAGIPIALGYCAVSFTFGIVAVSSGLNPLEAVLLSALNVTSAGQFAGLNIIIATGSYIEMILSQFVINMRYSLMSIALSQKADESVNGIYRWIFPFFHTDEIFAVAIGEKVYSKKFFGGLLILPFLGWTLGTLIGAVGGSILPNEICNGLGIALYGMFIAIFVPPARENKSILFAILISVLLSCCFRYIPGINKISSGFSVIICAVAAAMLGAWLWPIEEEADK